MNRPLRVVLADDDVLLREGLAGLLGRFGHDVVGSVGDARALVEVMADVDADVVVTDVRMPPDRTDDGLRAAVELRSRRPTLPVLVLSQYVEQTYAGELLGSGDGGVGYLLKERVGEVEEFMTALDQVAAGGTVIDPEVVRQLLRRRGGDPLDQLTARERTVLTLMAQGMSNGAIARSLFVSEAAVTKHIGNIFAKLHLATDGEDHRRVLAVLAYLGVPLRRPPRPVNGHE